MSKDLAAEFLHVRNLLLEERERIWARLEYLNQILAGSIPPDVFDHESVDTSGLLEASAQPGREGRRRGRKPSAGTGAPLGPLQITPAAHEFPVAVFPFPARAMNAFQRMEIKKLGQLEGLRPEELGKRTGRKTIEALVDVIARVNSGDLHFPTSVPVQSFCNLVDLAIDQLGEAESTALRMRFAAEGGEPMTLEEIGEKLNLTRERVRQLVDMAISTIPKVHGMKLTQIGKELTTLARERAIDLPDVSDASNPPRYDSNFYMALLKKLYPGLQTISENVASTRQEPSSPEDLREKIFG